MPIYEYKCKSCSEKFEVRLGFFQDSKKVKCPKCGRENPERVFSPFTTDSTKGDGCAPKPFSFG